MTKSLNLPKQPTAICVPIGEELIVLFFSDINKIEAHNNCCKIYCKGNAAGYLTRITLKEVDEMLPLVGFHRVHEKYIVAERLIKKFNRHRTRVMLTDESWLPVGRTYKNALAEIFPTAVTRKRVGDE